MPTPNARYGRAHSSGLDERQQLRSIAALLAANPKLKPTAAIRSIGVEDPAAIRRLRSRFRIEQGRLMADASRRRPASRSAALHSTVPPPLAPAVETPAAATIAPVIRRSSPPLPPPATAVIEGWCDLSFSAVAAAVEVQSVLAQFWLAMPAVAMATRGQLVLGSVAVAVHKRCKTRPLHVH